MCAENTVPEPRDILQSELMLVDIKGDTDFKIELDETKNGKSSEFLRFLSFIKTHLSLK